MWFILSLKFDFYLVLKIIFSWYIKNFQLLNIIYSWEKIVEDPALIIMIFPNSAVTYKYYFLAQLSSFLQF